LDDDVWKNDDMEIVIRHHLSLLVAISQHTARLKTSLLEKVLLTVLSCSPTVAHNFSLKMSQCLQYCVSKAGSATSGKKLSNGVKAVVLAMHNGPASVQKLRSSLGSSGAAASSSTVLPVRIPSNEVEEVVEDTPMEAAVGWDKESILKMYGVIASPPKRRCLRKEDSVVSVASSAVMEAVPPADHGSQAEPADAAVGVGGEALVDEHNKNYSYNRGETGGYIDIFSQANWVDLNEGKLCRITKAGLQEKADLKPGPDGFCVADFSDGVMVSECPNLLLHSVKKKPAAATVLKKPAAQEPRQQEETPPLEAAPEKEEEEEEGGEEEEKEKDSEVEASAEEAEDEPEESERKEEKKKLSGKSFPLRAGTTASFTTKKTTESACGSVSVTGGRCFPLEENPVRSQRRHSVPLAGRRLSG
jgi:hypothetical protein